MLLLYVSDSRRQPPVNLLKLKIIELLDKHKKITPVAHELDLKQPTITYHMKSLEQEMGVKLFEARADKMLLTAPGKALLHYAVRINKLAQEAERVVMEYGSLARGKLTIGASYVPATYVLPEVLSDFSKHHPGIEISVLVKPAPIIKEKLWNHDIHLGLISSEPFEQPSLSTHSICEDELVVIFAPNHHLAAYETLNPGLIATANFVLHGEQSSTREMTTRWLNNHRIDLIGPIELDSIEAIKQTVQQGGHIAFISELSVQEEVRKGQLLMRKIPNTRFQRSIYCCYNKDRYDSRLTEQFIDTLHRSFKNSPAPSINYWKN
ncbi:transcriptional regulator [Paenibacillus sp. BIHB 4019]|uniref:Transcriptional regulator n=1 Tax=Paenibacillus sp. BIHB 4019 TaxID=1870819 RepID=A0A1B2DGU1_9BACL|nr:transcriptional regulator [Paenibacillus sp. BIHB 4019]